MITVDLRAGKFRLHVDDATSHNRVTSRWIQLNKPADAVVYAQKFLGYWGHQPEEDFPAFMLANGLGDLLAAATLDMLTDDEVDLRPKEWRP